MKAATAIGIGVAFAALALSSMMDGTSPAAFLNPEALLIILGGTGGVTLASVGMDSMKRIPSLYKLTFSAEPPDMRGRLDLLVSLADQARRDGLLALDAQLGGGRGLLHPQRPAAGRRRHRPRDGARDHGGRGRRHGRAPRGRRRAL